MSDKSAKVIISLIGVAGLILYGYLLFMSDISVENQKYTVLAASIGVLYPLFSLTDNEFFIENKWKALGVGFASLCIILFAGYTSKVDTQDGLVWDFVNAITTDGYRYFYFFLLVVANICPLISKKLSVWLSPFTIGIMIPVIIASLLLLALIVVGLSILGAYGKSNKGSNSWSSILSSPSTSNTNPAPKKAQGPRKSVRTDVGNNKNSNSTSEEEKRRQKEIDFLTTGWTYGVARFKGRQPSSGMLLGGVNVWYNGSLTQTSVNGGVQIWEGTGDICVAYPRNYTGPKMEFYSSGGTVQIQVC